jgi:hypothetical protein
MIAMDLRDVVLDSGSRSLLDGDEGEGIGDVTPIVVRGCGNENLCCYGLS